MPQWRGVIEQNARRASVDRVVRLGRMQAHDRAQGVRLASAGRPEQQEVDRHGFWPHGQQP
jgi:hypothetical protein